jgi:hypothetical protein
MPAKKKAPKYDPKDKFVVDGADIVVYDKDGKAVPNKPRSFTELPYDVDDNGNPLPPPKAD